jgi:hypothetical protein
VAASVEPPKPVEIEAAKPPKTADIETSRPPKPVEASETSKPSKKPTVAEKPQPVQVREDSVELDEAMIAEISPATRPTEEESPSAVTNARRARPISARPPPPKAKKAEPVKEETVE